MKKQLSFTLLFLFTFSCTYCQSFFYDEQYYDADLLFEAGASFGLMHGITDVGDGKLSHINYSFFFGFFYKNAVEGRLEFTKGSIAGNDANSNNPDIRSRNLNYKSRLRDLSFIAALHPLMVFNADALPVVSPYIMAGAGVCAFYPTTLYDDKWVSLRPLNTEGQMSKEYPARKQYNIWAISVPVGLGVKYEFSAKYNFRLEGLYRFTTSDYLDDVSTIYVDRSNFQTDVQKILAHRYNELDPSADRTGLARGNPNNKDKFFSINLKVGYVIGRKKIPVNYNPMK